MIDKYHIIISDDVFARLDEIHEYVKRDSPQNAQALIDRLIRDMYSLEFMPQRCSKAISRRFPGGAYRKLISMPYLIFFRIDETLKAVYIVSIRHGAEKPI